MLFSSVCCFLRTSVHEIHLTFRCPQPVFLGLYILSLDLSLLSLLRLLFVSNIYSFKFPLEFAHVTHHLCCPWGCRWGSWMTIIRRGTTLHERWLRHCKGALLVVTINSWWTWGTCKWALKWSCGLFSWLLRHSSFLLKLKLNARDCTDCPRPKQKAVFILICVWLEARCPRHCPHYFPIYSLHCYLMANLLVV